MQTSPTKLRLISRLQWYYPLERFNAYLFLGITFLINWRFGIENTLYLTYSLLLMVFILFQGTRYWQLKLSSLRGQEIDHTTVAIMFQRFKKMNVLLVFFSPFVIIVQWWVAGQTLKDTQLGWALLANGFALLEHINYYHTQLMYDNRRDLNYLLVNKRLKTASLKKDLQEIKF